MDWYIVDAEGKPLEARLTIDDSRVTLHSRSGRPRNALPGERGRNPDYVAAFDTLFARMSKPTQSVGRVLLDSSPARKAPEDARLLAARPDFEEMDLEEVKQQIRTRMRGFGRAPGLPANEGNQNKKIRVDTKLDAEELVSRLRAVPITPPNPAAAGTQAGQKHQQRWPADVLREVTTVHVQAALVRLDKDETLAGFADSRDYDALTGTGRRYAPKQVFGIALQEATGTAPIPANFSADWGTPCFDILEDSGLWIVPKPGGKGSPRPIDRKSGESPKSFTPTDEERTWVEGNPRIAKHLVRERKPGLAKKKREQFALDHGKLFCERCELDPEAVYGAEAGSACIKVHHARTHVADMEEGHETSLDDLQCLCANCDRVLHRALSLGVAFKI